MSTEADTAEHFLNTVANALGWPPQVREEGATHILSGEAGHWDISVCFGASTGFWFESSVRWPGFPPDVAVEYAPVGGYARAKFTELGEVPPATGNATFDDVFLALTLDRAPMPHGVLTPDVQQVLLRHQVLRLTLSTAAQVRSTDGGMVVTHPEPDQVRLTCRPDLRDDGTGSVFVKVGTQRFTAAYCAEMAQQLLVLIGALERAL